MELVQIERFAGRLPRRFGRKPWVRQALARALVAKMVDNHPHTRATMEALRGSPVFRCLCGFVRLADIPSESTFSRAFKEFAEMGLGEKVHQALVEQWVTPELVGHISPGRHRHRGLGETFGEAEAPKLARWKKDRPRRGEEREPKPETRLERQGRQSAPEAPARLPVHCDVGTKKNSKG